jgi:hypothetical protein
MLAPPFEVRLRRLWRGRLGESWYFGGRQASGLRHGGGGRIGACASLGEVDSEAVEAIGGVG